MQTNIDDALYGKGTKDQSWRDGVVENLKALKAARQYEKYWGLVERSQIDHTIKTISSGGRITWNN